MHRIDSEETSATIELTYAQRSFRKSVPKFLVPGQGMPADVAYQLIHDELMFDCQPGLNLASFLTTWMEPQAQALIDETLNKNLIDRHEYARVAAIEQRVINMLAHLFHVPGNADAVGTTTAGSSEAIMLGLLAHKKTWQKRCAARGLSTANPNLVFGADSHTCIEKFARYFDVEPRIAPLHSQLYTTHVTDIKNLIDESTIAVVGILGTTFTGQMDDLAAINEHLAGLRKQHAWHIPLHIDAASGGMVVPFSRPDLAWDFRLSEVRSINVSNHKYGLVYPGMGTLIFREKADLPEELIFHINYLGGDMPNYSLNFSRPSALVIAQYYNLLRLGHAGYAQVISTVLTNARYLASQLRQMGMFEVIGDATIFPIVVARAKEPKTLDVALIAEALHARGWVVPAYTLPANAQETKVLRFVVRENLSRDSIETLLDNLKEVLHRIQGKQILPSLRQASLHPLC